MFEYTAKVLRVVDGDTLDLEIDLGFSVFHRVRVRLAGIDTPETFGVKKESEEYAAGLRAKTRVEELIAAVGGNVVVRTEKDKTGKYGRFLAAIYQPVLGSDEWPTDSLNDVLLHEGLATEYGS